ncbi:unnamed protein product [Cyprideis torosa]|uniref:Uncharacterized protein n=1 Tax=Cyprideis torosa TaxID=163714 RepID=A0A7R8ZIJ6_9CRUS|nr:unnamed protein product [Cyprideis torosa]CAG0886280.1 unnamed protein product [Cyprideis torosa]
MAEEEVIRRRLLIDGEGVGDDRRLNVFLKKFLTWINTDYESEQECQSAYQQLLSILTTAQLAAVKSARMQRVYEAEKKKFEGRHLELEREIQQAVEDIAVMKERVEHATQLRAHKLEYDGMAKIIAKHEDRITLAKKLAEKQSQLKVARDEKNALESQLASRQREFHSLVSTLARLRRKTLEEAEGPEPPPPDSPGLGAAANANAPAVSQSPSKMDVEEISDTEGELIKQGSGIAGASAAANQVSPIQSSEEEEEVEVTLDDLTTL